MVALSPNSLIARQDLIAQAKWAREVIFAEKTKTKDQLEAEKVFIGIIRKLLTEASLSAGSKAQLGQKGFKQVENPQGNAFKKISILTAMLAGPVELVKGKSDIQVRIENISKAFGEFFGAQEVANNINLKDLQAVLNTEPAKVEEKKDKPSEPAIEEVKKDEPSESREAAAPVNQEPRYTKQHTWLSFIADIAKGVLPEGSLDYEIFQPTTVDEALKEQS